MERRFSEPSIPGKEKVQLRSPFSPLAGPLLGVVLFGLQAAGIASPLPPGARFILAALVLVLWPGDIISRKILGFTTANLHVRILTSILAGLSTLALLAWMAMLWGASFTAFYKLAHIALLLVYLINIALVISRRGVQKRGSPRTHDFIKPRLGFLFLVLAALIGVFFLIYEGRIDSYGDAFDHIGYVRKIKTEDSLCPQGVLAKVTAAGEQQVKDDPRKGALHPVLALFSECSRLDPAVTWMYLPVILAPAALLAFVLFSLAILPSTAMVLSSTLLFLLFQGGIGREFLATIANGQNLSQIFFWALFALCISYLRGRRITNLALILLIFTGGAVIHLGFLVQFIVLLCSLALFKKILNLHTGNLIKLCAYSLAISGVVIVWRIVTSYEEGNIMHMHPHGLLYFGDDFYIVSPIEILRRYSILFLGGIVLIPGLFFIRTHRFQARICLAISVLPVLVGLNPLLVPLVYEKASYMVPRLLLNIPSFQIVVLVLGVTITGGRACKGMLKKIAAVLLIFLWAKFFLLPARQALSDTLHSLRFKLTREPVSQEFREVIDSANKVIHKGSVIISDPITSYAMSAFLDVRVVSVLHQHGNPNDPLVLERLAASRDVLSPFVTQRESMMDLEKYAVDYIVLNGSFSRPVQEFMAWWMPEFKSELRMKYLSLRDDFSVAYESSNVLILKVLGYEDHGETWIPTIPFMQTYRGELIQCDEVIHGEGIAVKKVSVRPKEILPGEEVVVAVMYERDYDLQYSLPLQLIVRFDNSEYISSFRTYPGNKFMRRIRERSRGFLSRYRVDHNIFEGLYPPDAWPIGSSVVEEFKVKLPRFLLEGEYDVQLKIVRNSLLPNYYLKDFLFNDDSYAGVTCAKIHVKKSLVR